MPIGACQVAGVCFSGNGPGRGRYYSAAARESDVRRGLSLRLSNSFFHFQLQRVWGCGVGAYLTLARSTKIPLIASSGDKDKEIT